MMSESLGSAILELRVDGTGLEKGLQQSGDRAHKVTRDINGRLRDENGRFLNDEQKRALGYTDTITNRTEATGKKIAKVGAGLSLAVTAPLIGFAKIAGDEMAEIQRANAQTAAVIQSTGGVANVTQGHVKKMAGSLQALSGVDDQAIQSGQNMLLTFTKIRNETGAGNKIFDRASEAMLNMSVAMGTDAKGAALQVGKALNDPIKGMASLGRAGVQFTKEQKAQITAMVKSGDQMGAQKLILKELETQFGGSAKAAGGTFPAQIAILKDSFAGLGAELLTTLMPTLKKMVGAASNMVEWFSQLSGGTKKMVAISLVLAAALGPVLVIAGTLAIAIPALTAAFAAISWPVVAVVAGIIALGAGMIMLYRKSALVRAIVGSLWDVLKISPIGQLVVQVNNVAKAVGGWGNVFQLAKLAFFTMMQSILEKVASVFKVLGKAPGEFGAKFRSMARAAEKDAANLGIQISGIESDLEGTAKAADTFSVQMQARLREVTTSAKTFEDSIAAAKRTWANWTPKAKTLRVQVQEARGKNGQSGPFAQPDVTRAPRAVRSMRSVARDVLPELKRRYDELAASLKNYTILQADSEKRISAQQKSVDALTDSLSELRTVQLAGTKAFSDEAFSLEQTMKRLELKQVDLRIGGAGDDDVQIIAIQAALDALKLKAQQLDLRESLELDPLRRQWNETINPIKELSLQSAQDQWLGLSTQHVAAVSELGVMQAAFAALTAEIQRYTEALAASAAAGQAAATARTEAIQATLAKDEDTYSAMTTKQKKSKKGIALKAKIDASKATLKAIPAFARGGILTGPTLALAGEYAGVRSNPEVISPLNDLKALLADSVQGGGATTVQQYFQGEPDPWVASRRAAFAFGAGAL